MTKATPKPKTGRRNHGTGHSYTLDGVKADGVTTVINNGVPKHALIDWAAKQAANYAIEELEYIQELLDKGENGRDAAFHLIKNAHARERDSAANRGTQVHNFAEALERGDDIEVPDILIGHVDAYIRWRHLWQPKDIYSELVVGNRAHRMMGTLDIICTIEKMNLGRCLIDIKTNRSGPFGEAGLQLAGYKFAEFYIDENGEEQPMIQVDGCYVLWLTEEDFEFIPYTVTEREYKILRHVQQVAYFTQVHSKKLRGEPLELKEETAA